MTIVMGVTQPGPSVVLMEKPETNLHARAQRALLGLLQEMGHRSPLRRVQRTHRSFLTARHCWPLLLVRVITGFPPSRH